MVRIDPRPLCRADSPLQRTLAQCRRRRNGQHAGTGSEGRALGARRQAAQRTVVGSRVGSYQGVAGVAGAQGVRYQRKREGIRAGQRACGRTKTPLAGPHCHGRRRVRSGRGRVDTLCCKVGCRERDVDCASGCRQTIREAAGTRIRRRGVRNAGGSSSPGRTTRSSSGGGRRPSRCVGGSGSRHLVARLFRPGYRRGHIGGRQARGRAYH